MMKVNLSPVAERDLEQIKEYISGELDNPAAANRVLAQITKRIRKLSQFPELGSSLETIVPFQTDYRFLVCGNYLAVYLVEQDMVLVDRVLYGKRDLVRALFDKLPKETSKGK